MKLLFDTHTFIWWDSNRGKLSQRALTVLEDSSHILLMSVVIPIPKSVATDRISRDTALPCPYCSPTFNKWYQYLGNAN